MASVPTAEAAAGREPAAGPGAMAGAPPAALASVVGLSVAAAIAAFLLIAPVLLHLVPATELPDPFPDQHQDAETLLFLLAFAVILPLAIRFVPRLADRIALAPNGAALPAITATLSGGLLALLVAVRISGSLPWGDGLWVLFAAMVIWCGAAAATLSRAAAPSPSPTLGRIAGMAEPIWWVTGGLLLGAAFALAFVGSIAPAPLLVGVAIAGAAAVAYGRVELPRMRRPWGIGFDIALAALVFLAVPNLVIMQPEVPFHNFETSIIHFHQDFFMGPASTVLGGGAILVDTLSQYGVGSIDFIAGWFALVGASNGTLGLIDGLLDGLVFAGAFLVLRAAGVSRVLAASAMAIGLVALVYGLVYPIGGLLQHGAIRFGLPMAIIVAAVAEMRFSRLAVAARIAMPVAVGISAIWALEAFAYTSFTFLAVVAVRAWLLPAGARRSWLLRRIGSAVLAGVIAHVAFAIYTLAISGELPNWGLYLATLRAFLIGKVGDLTYDFSAWSPGIAVGAVYLASTAGIALLVKRSRPVAEREAITVVALAASTAYGIALFSYLVNRSSDHIIPYVSLPALMVVVLWLSLLLRAPGRVSLRARRAALGGALGVSALLVAVAWSGAGERFSQSALAYAAPGGKSLGAAIDRLRDFPPLSDGATTAESMLDRYWPGENKSLVIAEPGLEIEALARTGRVNVLPISAPFEDSLVPEQRSDDLDQALADLTAGDRILLDAGSLASFKAFLLNPDRDPYALDANQTLVPSGLAPLQEYSLRAISLRFRLRIIEQADGLTVAELVPR